MSSIPWPYRKGRLLPPPRPARATVGAAASGARRKAHDANRSSCLHPADRRRPRVRHHDVCHAARLDELQQQPFLRADVSAGESGIRRDACLPAKPRRFGSELRRRRTGTRGPPNTFPCRGNQPLTAFPAPYSDLRRWRGQRYRRHRARREPRVRARTSERTARVGATTAVRYTDVVSL